MITLLRFLFEFLKSYICKQLMINEFPSLIHLGDSFCDRGFKILSASLVVSALSCVGDNVTQNGGKFGPHVVILYQYICVLIIEQKTRSEEVYVNFLLNFIR